jgi:hypothetical protein
MPARHLYWLLALSSAVLGVGCRPHIGDDCTTSVDCSQSGDRLCDITQPGGYCTVYNCEPGSCPSEAACVAFDAQTSPFPACRDANGLSRFQRAYCMLSCSSAGDCRAGYVCQDMTVMGSDNPYNAVLIDPDRGNKVCVAAFSGTSVTEKGDDRSPNSTEVCTGTPASGGTSSSTGGTAGASAELGGSASDAGGSGG